MRAAAKRVAAAAALATLAVPAAAQAATANKEPRLTSAHRVSADDQAPARTYLAPFISVDPEDSHNVIAATVDARARTCAIFRSTDSGETWRLLPSSPSPPSFPFCFYIAWMAAEVPVAWGRNHTLYVAFSGWDNTDGGQRLNKTVILARSTDLGDHWTTTVVRNARGKEGPEVENNGVSALAVDTHSGPKDIVYVGWQARFTNAPSGTPNKVQVASSADGGATFGDPVDVSSFYKKTVKDSTGKEWNIINFFGVPQLAVDDKGTLYAEYPGGTPSGFANAAPTSILVGKSTDRGKTFAVTEATPPGNYPEGVAMLRWSPTGGPKGTLHVVWEDKPDQPAGRADRDIYYVRSTDGGATWSKGVKLNDDADPTSIHLQVTPNLAVAPNGRVTAAWWDFRDDNGAFANDVYATYSTDDGQTWSKNEKITDQPINRRIGVWSNGSDMRAPPGIASTDKLTIFGWDDTRLGTTDTPLQDVFARTTQFEALGTSNSAATALAVVLGLTVAGLVFLFVALVVRPRRQAAPPPPARTTEDAPVGVG